MTTSETTETQRDLRADLAICSAASDGFIAESNTLLGPYGPYVEVSVLTDNLEQLTPQDTTFIIEARTGWPHAIERAIAAEWRVRELCESNAYYIKQAERAEDDSYYTREELEATRKELAQLRAGIALAMTYSGGIIVEMLRKLLTEVGANGTTQESGE